MFVLAENGKYCIPSIAFQIECAKWKQLHHTDCLPKLNVLHLLFCHPQLEAIALCQSFPNLDDLCHPKLEAIPFLLNLNNLCHPKLEAIALCQSLPNLDVLCHPKLDRILKINWMLCIIQNHHILDVLSPLKPPLVILQI